MPLQLFLLLVAVLLGTGFYLGWCISGHALECARKANDDNKAMLRKLLAISAAGDRKNSVADWQAICFGASWAAGWYHSPKTGERVYHNTGERLMLMVTELAEAFEGSRRGLKDDHLPTRDMLEVELADTIIRILDFAGAHDMDIEGAMRDKLEYNRHRLDHKKEARLAEGGKTC